MKNKVSTDAFARAVGVSPNTIRQALCQRGHYLGVRPLKLPNRLLAWPGEQIEAMLSDKTPSGIAAGATK